MLVLKLDVPQEKISEMESQAHARGFSKIEDYILALVGEDQQEDIDHSPEEVAASLERAWNDIQAGRLLTEADYRKAMAEDD